MTTNESASHDQVDIYQEIVGDLDEQWYQQQSTADQGSVLDVQTTTPVDSTSVGVTSLETSAIHKHILDGIDRYHGRPSPVNAAPQKTTRLISLPFNHPANSTNPSETVSPEETGSNWNEVTAVIFSVSSCALHLYLVFSTYLYPISFLYLTSLKLYASLLDHLFLILYLAQQWSPTPPGSGGNYASDQGQDQQQQQQFSENNDVNMQHQQMNPARSNQQPHRLSVTSQNSYGYPNSNHSNNYNNHHRSNNHVHNNALRLPSRSFTNQSPNRLMQTQNRNQSFMNSSNSNSHLNNFVNNNHNNNNNNGFNGSDGGRFGPMNNGNYNNSNNNGHNNNGNYNNNNYSNNYNQSPTNSNNGFTMQNSFPNSNNNGNQFMSQQMRQQQQQYDDPCWHCGKRPSDRFQRPNHNNNNNNMSVNYGNNNNNFMNQNGHDDGFNHPAPSISFKPTLSLYQDSDDSREWTRKRPRHRSVARSVQQTVIGGGGPLPFPVPDSTSTLANHEPTLNSHSRLDAKFFVLKSFNFENIRISRQNGIWATGPGAVRRLEAAYQRNHPVFLLFSVNGSGGFQGIARMQSEVGVVDFDGWHGVRADQVGPTFQVRWLLETSLNMCHVGDMGNPLDDWQPLKMSRNGQEIPFAVGREVVRLFGVEGVEGDLLEGESERLGENGETLSKWSQSTAAAFKDMGRRNNRSRSRAASQFR